MNSRKGRHRNELDPQHSPDRLRLYGRKNAPIALGAFSGAGAFLGTMELTNEALKPVSS